MRRIQYILSLVVLIVVISSCNTQHEKSKEISKKPNILLLVADDMGLSDIGPFGSEIQTPALNKLANQGVILSNFHVLPTCSPSRSVLLSGTDNHIAGLGAMGEMTTSKVKENPGYEGHLNKTVAVLPELLKNAGYHTYMVGKWHLGEEEGYKPSDRGFEQTFALLGGGGSHWSDQKWVTPIVPVEYSLNGNPVETLPEDFYSTKTYTDYILKWLEADKESDKPFFVYAAYTAPHDPLHAPEEYIKKYKGTYDGGFDVLRDARFQRLKELGLVNENTNQFPWNGAKWEELTVEEQQIASRGMEVYAAMIDYMDMQISRIFDWLEESGKMDNTLVIFISDNGANGGLLENYPGQTEEYMNTFDNSLENIGLPNSLTDMGPNWASASMAPFRLFKGFTSEGGIKAPCIIKLPKGMKSNESMINSFAHISDLMPTFLELAQVSHPSTENQNIPPMMGKSIIPLLSGETNDIHLTEGVGYELHGSRAYFRDEWKIVSLPPPFGTGDWQLYNLVSDPSETNDLSEEHPEKRNELITGWNDYSQNVGVVFDPLN